MKVTPTVLAAWGAGAAVAAVVATVVIMGNQQNEPLPDSSKASETEATSKRAAGTPAIAGIDPVLWEPPTRPIFPALSPAAADPARCAPVQKQAEELLVQFEKQVPPADRKKAQDIVAKAVGRGQSEADGYSSYAAGEMLQGRIIPAMWGGLNALSRVWNSRHVTNVGVYLMYLNRLDEAEPFLDCALAMDRFAIYAMEAKALLAHRRKNCPTASQWIDKALSFRPDDMNLQYTAGVIAYQCGNRQKAVQHLRAARELKPDDRTVRRALAVVSPNEPPPRCNDALCRLIRESFRFMDTMLARAEVVARYVNEVTPPGGEPATADKLREFIREQKREILQREAEARQTAHPSYWNAAILACITAYTGTADEYHQVIGGRGAFLVLAAAHGLKPEQLRERFAGELRGDYNVVLDEPIRYDTAMKPIADALHHAVNACAPLQHEASKACTLTAYQRFCGAAMPIWHDYRSAIYAILSRLEHGTRRAITDYVNLWIPLANQSADYTKRAVAAMRPLPPEEARKLGIAGELSHPALARRFYEVHIAGGIAYIVTTLMQSLYADIERGVQEAPGYVEHPPRPDLNYSCEPDRPGKGRVDTIAELLDALKASCEYGAEFKLDCELEIGSFTKSFNFGPPSADLEYAPGGGDISLAAEIGPDRWGASVEYSVSDLSPPVLGPVGVASEVSVSVWGEGDLRRAGQTDYGAAANGRLGAGIGKDGVGKVVCYLVNVEGKVNARQLADRLLR